MTEQRKRILPRLLFSYTATVIVLIILITIVTLLSVEQTNAIFASYFGEFIEIFKYLIFVAGGLYLLIVTVSLLLFLNQKKKSAQSIKKLVEIEFQIEQTTSDKELKLLYNSWLEVSNTCLDEAKMGSIFHSQEEVDEFITTIKERKATITSKKEAINEA